MTYDEERECAVSLVDATTITTTTTTTKDQQQQEIL
jgi:hypothetical protein